MARTTQLERIALGAVLLATLLAGLANHGAWPAIPRFLIATFALLGLAWTVTFATEQVGGHLGPSVTGVLQATLANLPELFVIVFALNAGELIVAQTAIVGSMLANALLLLGLVIVVGARRAKDGVMRFGTRLPNDTVTLLLVMLFVVVLCSPALGIDVHVSHVKTISLVSAGLMLAVYGVWLLGYLPRDGRRTSRAAGGAISAAGVDDADLGSAAGVGGVAGARGPAEAAGLPVGSVAGARSPAEAAGLPRVPDAVADSVASPRLSLRTSLVLLLLGGAGSAFVSEWFVNAIRPATHALHISLPFAGLVIVALAGNAVEHSASVALAARGQSELAISVVKSSVGQIAGFLYPLAVIVSVALSTTLTFALAPVYIGALALMTLVVWQVSGDGEATAFEGWALIALYVVVAVVAAYQ